MTLGGKRQPNILKMPIPLAQLNCFELNGGDGGFHAAPHPAPATKTVAGTAPLQKRGALLCYIFVNTTKFPLSFGEGVPEGRG